LFWVFGIILFLYNPTIINIRRASHALRHCVPAMYSRERLGLKLRCSFWFLVSFELPSRKLGSDERSLGTQSGSRAGKGKWLPGPMGLMVKAPVGISGARKRAHKSRPRAMRGSKQRQAMPKQWPAKHIPFWFSFGYGTPMGWHASMKHSPEKGLCGA